MTILGNNLKRIFSKPINIIFMIVVPIVLNIVFMSVSSVSGQYLIGVVDYDKTELTSGFIEEIKQSGTLIDIQESDINSKVLNRDVDLVLLFEEGFTQKLIKGEDASVKTYSMEESNSAEPMNMFIESFVSSAKAIGKAANGDSEKFYKGMDNYYDSQYVVNYKTFDFSLNQDVNRAVSSLGYMAMGTMFLLSFATILILEDKKTRVFDRLGTTPVTRASYFVQHLLSYFIVALIQISAMVNILPSVVDISFGDAANEIIIVGVVFALACISIGLLISRFSKNTIVANSMIGLVNLPILMLGGCLWPRELMPEFVKRIGDFVPTTWFLKAAETVLYGNGLYGARFELLYLLLFTAVLLIITFSVKAERSN